MLLSGFSLLDLLVALRRSWHCRLEGESKKPFVSPLRDPFSPTSAFRVAVRNVLRLTRLSPSDFRCFFRTFALRTHM